MAQTEQKGTKRHKKTHGDTAHVRHAVGMSLREYMRISVTKHAKKVTKDWLARTGQTEIFYASRLHEWAAEQDDAFRLAITGMLPRGQERAIIRRALAKLGKGKR